MTFEIFMMILTSAGLAMSVFWLIPFRRSPAVTDFDADAEKPSAEAHPGVRWGGVGQFDIAPGETRTRDGERDIVLESSMQSFPASDPPAY